MVKSAVLPLPSATMPPDQLVVALQSLLASLIHTPLAARETPTLASKTSQTTAILAISRIGLSTGNRL
jgi:hypothetical protein